ncbi:MAG TPA: biopolymer transporter ExbD [Verrucomicrobiae bacterium]|jgi:biopolymer transport protein ExbD
MRRFSQRSHLVTLSEINITPLLDLAFVLLIIFVITTPLLEKGLDLKLPKSNGVPDKTINPHNIRTVDVSNTGYYLLDHKRLSLDQVTKQLAQEFRDNPSLIVYIRADGDGPYRNVAAVLDGCQHNGITRYSLRTQPTQ